MKKRNSTVDQRFFDFVTQRLFNANISPNRESVSRASFWQGPIPRKRKGSAVL